MFVSVTFLYLSFFLSSLCSFFYLFFIYILCRLSKSIGAYCCKKFILCLEYDMFWHLAVCCVCHEPTGSDSPYVPGVLCTLWISLSLCYLCILDGVMLQRMCLLYETSYSQCLVAKLLNLLIVIFYSLHSLLIAIFQKLKC